MANVSGIGGIAKPAISAAAKIARAGAVKKVKLAVKVKIKKSLNPAGAKDDG